jgi:hypothetical protein
MGSQLLRPYVEIVFEEERATDSGWNSTPTEPLIQLPMRSRAAQPKVMPGSAMPAIFPYRLVMIFIGRLHARAAISALIEQAIYRRL